MYTHKFQNFLIHPIPSNQATHPPTPPPTPHLPQLTHPTYPPTITFSHPPNFTHQPPTVHPSSHPICPTNSPTRQPARMPTHPPTHLRKLTANGWNCHKLDSANHSLFSSIKLLVCRYGIFSWLGSSTWSLIVTTPTQPQHHLNLTQLSWVWHDYCCSHPTHHSTTGNSTSIECSIRSTFDVA